VRASTAADVRPEIDETRRRQAAAADPNCSAWVSANAGTGKTHVVSLRVLLLLLLGTNPERLLALTFTKAAAAEMKKRVFDRLAEWALLPESALYAKLAELLGRAPSAAEMRRARQLFAIAIETPGGFKVETIHAFCERLLQRFPLEAGVTPGFVVLEDHERAHVLKQAMLTALAEIARTPEGPLAEDLEVAVAHAGESSLELLLDETLKTRDWLDEAERLQSAGAGAEARYRRALRLAEGVTLAGVREGLASLFSRAELIGVRDALAAGSPQEVRAARRVAEVLAASDHSGRVAALRELFLTQEGKPRQSLTTAATAERRPDLAALLQRAQERFLEHDENRLKLAVLAASLALLRLGQAVMRCYAAEKARCGALDFDDLVRCATQLLGGSAAVDWVLYKLDGGLDHILLDEAQDTSPAQWALVSSLAEEFFAGRGAREEVRTVFAVGDAKQSIYGFQGAKPEMFAAMGEAFAIRARAAGRSWRNVPLTLSFRAVEPLLAAIDAIFADPERTPGIAESGAIVVHSAHRKGHAGLLEVWPVEKCLEPAKACPWEPLSEAPAASPVARLAQRIAATIAGWLERKERLPSENRPIRPGDILVLVRRRAPFAPAMVRALKANGVAVAGADRLRLIDEIAVQDLLALGDFICLPEDDLALAALLKSPLLGFDDDDLLHIAAEREGSLWQSLGAAAASHPRFARAAAALTSWQECARRLTPFAFYAGLLDTGSTRAAILTRLGADAADALDEFLARALAYEQTPGATLQGFLVWLRASADEIKRDMEQGRDEVRVMTIHGAKGLEAPIVFLPDTCSTNAGRRAGGLVSIELEPGSSPALLWPVKGAGKLDAVRRAREAEARTEAAERTRLLYVALTRARDRLYIAGYEGRSGAPADDWYNLIRQSLADRLRAVAMEPACVWRLETEQAREPEPAIARAAVEPRAPLPDWAKAPAREEPRVSVPLLPSHVGSLPGSGSSERRPSEPPVLGLARRVDEGRLLRGELVHALLEQLPPLPRQARPAAARALLELRASKLPRRTRSAILAETLRVIEHAEWAPLFGPGSRAEVPICAELPHPDGRRPGLSVTGKIDRLAVLEDAVWIVDYKTSRPHPQVASQVPEPYLLQLAAYRLVIARVFPDRPVAAALLWTEAPAIMRIADSVLDDCEGRLWALARPGTAASDPDR
jgi:ATP-dependent helicase/nuclease subunit A